MNATLDLLQKLILVEYESHTIRLCGPAAEQLTVTNCPEDIELEGSPVRKDQGWLLTLRAKKRRTAYRSLTVEIGLGGETRLQEIPTRIFGVKEHFLCMVTTSNFHWGYNPGKVKEIEQTASRGFITCMATL